MHPNPDTRRAILAGGVGLPLIVALAVAAFTWPSARLEPRDVPLGVAGAGAPGVELRLAERSGAFDIHRYADETAAREAIMDREVYGALVASADGTTLLTASAGSPAVAQLLEEAFASPEVRSVDVVPADPDDPRGAAFSSLVLPLTLVGVLAGLIAALFAPPGLGRVTSLLGSSLLAGLAAVAVVQGWLGVLPGDWWLNAGVLGLVVLAIGSLVAGAWAALGRPGLGLAAVLLVFCGNPWSGISSAPELLPAWTGLVGRLLPPGAGGSLLRSTAFFDGHGAAGPLTVLLVWAALGLTAVWLLAYAGRRGGGRADAHAQPA
jgi:hypothetical protein